MQADNVDLNLISDPLLLPDLTAHLPLFLCVGALVHYLAAVFNMHANDHISAIIFSFIHLMSTLNMCFSHSDYNNFSGRYLISCQAWP